MSESLPIKLESMHKITLDGLFEMVSDCLSNKKQETPAIVWFDGKLVLDNNTFQDYAAFGLWLSEQFPSKVVCWDKAGSPLTDRTRRYDKDGNIIAISDEERNEFCVPDLIKSENGKLVTKLFIHFMYICYIGEKGPTSIEYGIQLHDKLNLPVMLFYPYAWKDRIEAMADLSGYEQYICFSKAQN